MCRLYWSQPQIIVTLLLRRLFFIEVPQNIKFQVDWKSRNIINIHFVAEIPTLTGKSVDDL